MSAANIRLWLQDTLHRDSSSPSSSDHHGNAFRSALAWHQLVRYVRQPHTGQMVCFDHCARAATAGTTTWATPIDGTRDLNETAVSSSLSSRQRLALPPSPPLNHVIDIPNLGHVVERFSDVTCASPRGADNNATATPSMALDDTGIPTTTTQHSSRISAVGGYIWSVYEYHSSAINQNNPHVTIVDGSIKTAAANEDPSSTRKTTTAASAVWLWSIYFDKAGQYERIEINSTTDRAYSILRTHHLDGAILCRHLLHCMILLGGDDWRWDYIQTARL